MEKLEFNIPKGYIVNEEKSTDTKLVFEIEQAPCSLTNKPRWEDFGAVSGYYISAWCEVSGITSYETDNTNKNTFPSEEEAEACLALSQLLQWRDKYNKEPLEKWCNWDDGNQTKYGFKYVNHDLKRYSFYGLRHSLCFKTPFLRDKFIKDFKELIEVAKPLL